VDRGESSSFGFGRGVAIPHAAIPGLEQPIGVFACLKPAQTFGTADERPADLVFLLLSPHGDDPTHLRVLARVARRLRDREIAARLRSANDADAIHVVLTSDTWRGADVPRRSAQQGFDKRGNVNERQRIMLSCAHLRRGLYRAGNLIAGK
jgi:PTS system nitrogen regulatory IIA component